MPGSRSRSRSRLVSRLLPRLMRTIMSAMSWHTKKENSLWWWLGPSGRGHNVDINKHQGICLRLNDCRDNSTHTRFVRVRVRVLVLVLARVLVPPLIVFVGQFTLAIILCQ